MKRELIDRPVIPNARYKGNFATSVESRDTI